MLQQRIFLNCLPEDNTVNKTASGCELSFNILLSENTSLPPLLGKTIPVIIICSVFITLYKAFLLWNVHNPCHREMWQPQNPMDIYVQWLGIRGHHTLPPHVLQQWKEINQPISLPRLLLSSPLQLFSCQCHSGPGKNGSCLVQVKQSSSSSGVSTVLHCKYYIF